MASRRRLRRIGRLPEMVAALAPADRELFDRLFRVSVSEGRLRAPESMRGWLEDRFGSAKAVERQTVVRVTNRWTLEEAVFNPLRARRPKAPAKEPPAAGEDPLLRPLELTPEDTFGRIEGEHCLTAANVAGAAAWHGLIVLREPDPLAFTRESVRDCLATALRWWQAAHEQDAEAVYPLLFWNCGVAAGASLGHAHLQVLLARSRHFGAVERLRAAAEEYRARHGADYFRDLVRAHAALGMAVTYKGAAVLASLAPAREREIMIIAPSIEEGMAEAVYATLACYRDRLSVRAFNLALFGPPLVEGDEDWRRFPFVARLVERGASDVGALELFAAAVVSHDPFELADALAAELEVKP
jgi:hypothetical protein